MNGRTNAKNGGGAIRDGCAVLEIRCLADSVITAIRADGLKKIQKKGYIDLNDTNYWFYYIIIAKTELSSSIWTITATSGANIMTTTAVIDSSKQYIITFRLPNIYQEVEYIASSGTQYIITDIAPRDITKLCVQFKPTAAYDIVMICGARNGTAYDQDIRVGRYTSQNYNMAVIISGVTIKDFDTMSENKMYNIEADIITKKAIINDVEYNMSGNIVKINPVKVSIFGFNTGSVSAKIKAQLYSLSFYNENGIIEEFIPCYRISDSVVGLWGRYAEKFYTNNGTGTFTAGPDVNI